MNGLAEICDFVTEIYSGSRLLQKGRCETSIWVFLLKIELDDFALIGGIFCLSTEFFWRPKGPALR